MNSVIRIGRLCARTSIFFYTLIWLMFLLVAGTVAQKDIGLYQSQRLFFSSFVYWMGPVPLPGGFTTLAVIFVNLLARLLFTTKWIWQRLGTIITHLGALLLLVGAFLTAVYSTEGAMVIEEGGRTNIVSDYHAVELAFINTTNPEYDEVTQVPQSMLYAGNGFFVGDQPFMIDIHEYHENTRPQPRAETPDAKYKGFAKMFQLLGIPRAKEDAENHAGITFGVRDNPKAAKDVQGVYSVFERMSIPQTLTLRGGETYRVELRRAQRRTPFVVKLIDFEQKHYPGTMMAQSYSSVVEVIDGDVTQRSLIEMNRPLRYKGYTLFQSSFMEGTAGEEASVFAVVRNAGRLFPYISSIVMCIGLLIHLLIQIPQHLRRRRENS